MRLQFFCTEFFSANEYVLQAFLSDVSDNISVLNIKAVKRVQVGSSHCCHGMHNFFIEGRGRQTD